MKKNKTTENIIMNSKKREKNILWIYSIVVIFIHMRSLLDLYHIMTQHMT